VINPGLTTSKTPTGDKSTASKPAPPLEKFPGGAFSYIAAKKKCSHKIAVFGRYCPNTAQHNLQIT